MKKALVLGILAIFAIGVSTAYAQPAKTIEKKIEKKNVIEKKDVIKAEEGAPASFKDQNMNEGQASGRGCNHPGQQVGNCSNKKPGNNGADNNAVPPQDENKKAAGKPATDTPKVGDK